MEMTSKSYLSLSWRPSDLEQRIGRIARFGNENDVIRVYNYVTRNSFDAYLWAIIERKARFIAQIMSGNDNSRVMEDIDGTVLNYAQVKAIATGNPLIVRHMELELRLRDLRTLENQYRKDRYAMETAVSKSYPTEIARQKERITALTADIERRDANKRKDFSITLGSKTFDERKEAGSLILRALATDKYNGRDIGVYRGFTIRVPEDNGAAVGGQIQPRLCLQGNLRFEVELSGDPVGSMIRLDNWFAGLESNLDRARQRLAACEGKLESSKKELDKPFGHAAELEAVLAEMAELSAKLSLDEEVAVILDSPDESENDEENETGTEEAEEGENISEDEYEQEY